VNTKSLEDIVKKYLALAEERTEAARQQSQQTADDVDDLDVLQTPERCAMFSEMLEPSPYILLNNVHDIVRSNSLFLPRCWTV